MQKSDISEGSVMFNNFGKGWPALAYWIVFVFAIVSVGTAIYLAATPFLSAAK
jgi:hypothetical protein